MAANVKVVRRKEANGEWESAESLLRRFKKAVQKADIMKEVRKREFFIKKPLKRKLKSEEHQKLMRRKANKNKKRP
jgi:small subunit ribosomal protein S21